MARSLYSKFVLGYLIFGLLSVLTIATFSSGITPGLSDQGPGKCPLR